MDDMILDLGNIVGDIVQQCCFAITTQFLLQNVAKSLGQDTAVGEGIVCGGTHGIEIVLTLFGVEWRRRKLTVW